MTIIEEIEQELEKAIKKHPFFTKDIIHQVAIVNEEAGEATRAAINLVYEGGSIEELRKELIQTAAMCIRMIKCIDIKYYSLNDTKKP